jgi:hypothetical protein
MHAQWTSRFSVSIAIWTNEDGEILVSDDEVTIFKTSGELHSFTAEVNAPYSGVQWYLDAFPISGSRGTNRSITVNAKDYNIGSYRLGVSVTKDGAPHSTQIYFTVKD